MKEQIYCPVCNKKKWAEVTIIDIGLKENTIEVTCPKCKSKLKKIIGKPS